MMDKNVCILLNEREPHKKDASQVLQTIFSKQGFTPLVLPVLEVPELIAELQSSNPFALIVDYLLGDLLTGFDLLAALPQGQHSISTFLFTDDPSQSIAIEAFRLGVRDAFRIDHPGEIQKLTQSVAACWLDMRVQEQRSEKRAEMRMVYTTKESRDFINSITQLSERPLRGVVVVGPSGSGKKTAVREFFSQSHLPLQHYNLFQLRISDIIVSPQHECILIEDVLPQNVPELISLLNRPSLLEAYRPARICITTSSAQVASSLQKILHYERLECPALIDRGAEELRALTMSLASYAADLGLKTQLTLSEEDLIFLANRPWPNNFVDFQSVILEALLLLKTTKDPFERCLKAASDRVAKEHNQLHATVSREMAALTCSRERGNVHRSAVLLGLHPRELSELLLKDSQP
jgi:DNA-binding NtrC family response regulator